MFASSSEQRDGSLLINADSLKSNNKLTFREGCIAMKGRYDVGMKDKRGMTAGLKDNLAWFHTLYLLCLTYLKVLGRKMTFFGC